MRLDLIFLLIVLIYLQAFARPEIVPGNPFFIHPSSAAELRKRAEISSQASSEDSIVALDNSAAAVANRFPDTSNPFQPTVPSGKQETDLSAAGSTDTISLADPDKDCSSSSSRKFRKRKTCSGKANEDSTHGEDTDPALSPTDPESGCSPPSSSKLQKRQYCGSSSGSDEPEDDSSFDRGKRFCPPNRKTLCCKGPKPSGIYTQGCSYFTSIFDPRCEFWNINCCVYYISNAKPGSDTQALLNDEGVGVFCYTPLFFPIP